MNQYILFGLSFSIFIAGIIAFIRFKNIHKSFYPFLYCIWIACLNEVLSFFLIKNHHTTYINNNVYVILEALLIAFFFKNLGLFSKIKTLFYILISGYVITWAVETLVLEKISTHSVYFRIFYSFTITLMSITTINELISRSTKRILTNATFLLCAGFIIYFTYKVLIFAFWIYGLNSGTSFLLKTFQILTYINLLVNLIYALAVLWMPRKLEFTLPS